MDLAEEDDSSKSSLKLLLRMDPNKKLHGKYKDHNAIEILFQLYKDVPEEVAQEMVPAPHPHTRRRRLLPSAAAPRSPVGLSVRPQVVLGFVCEADYKLVAKAIRHRVTAIKRQREKQRRLLEEEPEMPSDRAETTQSASVDAMPTNQVCFCCPRELRKVRLGASCWQFEGVSNTVALPHSTDSSPEQNEGGSDAVAAIFVWTHTYFLTFISF